MNNWMINNFWIKIISLILAVITWFYVNEELVKEKKMAKQLYKSSVISQTQMKTSFTETKGFRK
jgi:YbbR domain-containing protein